MYNLFTAEGVPFPQLPPRKVLPMVAGGDGLVLLWIAFTYDQKMDVKIVRETVNDETYGCNVI